MKPQMRGGAGHAPIRAMDKPLPPPAAPPLAAPAPDATPAASATGRAYAGRDAQARAAARRARLVDAGIALFGTLGLRATTVRKVCEAAGLTDRYFYESFANVEALLRAVYAVLLQRLVQALAQAAADAAAAGHTGLEGRFTAGYSAWFDFVREPLHARILLDEVLGVSPAVDAAYEAGMRAFSDALAEPLNQAGADPLRSALVSRALVGAVVQVAKMWQASGYKAPRDEVVRSCVLVAVGTVQALRQAHGWR